MSRDGHRDMDLAAIRKYAEQAYVELDSRHGDPLRNGNWIRERRLAAIVLALVDRIRAAAEVVEVPS